MMKLEEVLNSIEEWKNGKTPGPDHVPNEAYKNLPPSWIHYLNNLFHLVWNSENIPTSWGLSRMSMIYKIRTITEELPFSIQSLNCSRKSYIKDLRNGMTKSTP